MLPESDKWGWKHVSVFGGFDKGSGTKRWKCNHCNLRYNGSYSRVRAHLLGFSGVGVKSCPAIDGSLREGFRVLEEERLARKSKRVSRSEKPGKRARTSRPSISISKEEVDDAVARFLYASGLNINVVNSHYFREMIKATGSYGSRYEPPATAELSDSFLSKERARIEKSMILVRESWAHTGCSVLCVGRLESRFGFFHINVFVSCPRGIVFLKSVDIANDDGAENCLLGVLVDVITEVGPANVLQIVSHTGHAKQLSDSIELTKFPRIFLSRCTSHSICLLMEEIAEMDWIKAVVIRAKEIERCLIAYKKFSPSPIPQITEGSSDPVASKFAPFFCIVQRIFELKQTLKEVAVSYEWKQWKLDTSVDTAETEVAILEDSFWGDAEFLLQVFEPFVRLLGPLHIDRFFIGDICNWRVQALEEVRSKGLLDGVRLNQLEELIASKWDALFSPLHAASYILNPRHFGKGQAKDKIVMKGWKATLERYEGESTNRQILREQLSSYWRLEGSLGDEDAVHCRDKMDPIAWWENFGFEIPLLQTLAIKILSQVSSVTMCEEICQDDGGMCREAAYRLGVDRVEDLVFVQNNLRIHSQKNGISCLASGPRNLSYALLLPM